MEILMASNHSFKKYVVIKFKDELYVPIESLIQANKLIPILNTLRISELPVNFC